MAYPYLTPVPKTPRSPVKGKKANRLRKFRGKRVTASGEPKSHNKGTLPDRKSVVIKPGLGGGKAPYYEVSGKKASLPSGLTKYNGGYKRWI